MCCESHAQKTSTSLTGTEDHAKETDICYDLELPIRTPIPLLPDSSRWLSPVTGGQSLLMDSTASLAHSCLVGRQSSKAVEQEGVKTRRQSVIAPSAVVE